MLSCEEATRLVSEKLDHKLPFWKRMSVRLHVAMCRACSRYTRQIQALDEAVSKRYQSDAPAQTAQELSNEALVRIKSSIQLADPNSNSRNAE